jgi:hypothetical protein
MAGRKKIRLKGIQDIRNEIDRRIGNGTIKFTESINMDDELLDELIPIGEEIEENEEDDEEYLAQSNTVEISFIEFAIINSYLHASARGKHDEIMISSHGQVDSSHRVNFGGVFEPTAAYWFTCKLKNDDNDFIIQTQMYLDSRNELYISLHLSAKKGITFTKFEEIENLVEGDLIFKAVEHGAQLVEFESVETIDQTRLVYKFNVSPTNTLIAGGIVVHNAKV